MKAEEEKGKRNVKHKQSEFCPTGPCAIGREGHYDAAAILAERKWLKTNFQKQNFH